MKATLFILTALFTLNVIGAERAPLPVRETPEKVEAKVDPLDSLNQAIAKAKKANKLVLVVIETPNISHAELNPFGVGPASLTSVLVKSAILDNNRFNKFKDDNLISLTVDSNSPVANKLNLSHPNLVLLDGEGKVLRNDTTKYKWMVDGKESWMQLTNMNVSGLIKNYSEHLPKVKDKSAK
tara:strand:+ start:2892 stop:3437 length:546 start_codon:yes stop_codon:yes gene_type:complete